MDRVSDTFNLPTLTHGDIENLNRPVTKMEIESVMMPLPTKKNPGWMTSMLNSMKFNKN